MDDTRINFGKHKGKRLSEIPLDYVQWLAKKSFDQEIRQAAHAYLERHPAPARRVAQPGPPPRTLREARKLGWMAGRGYGNARVTLLAARDTHGLLCVCDEDFEDEDEMYCLVTISDEGRVMDPMAVLSEMRYEAVKVLLAQYPHLDPDRYLIEIAEREREQAELDARSVTLISKNGAHTIVLHIYGSEAINVTIDGEDQYPLNYLYRLLTNEELLDPRWDDAEAALVPDEAYGQWIGLSAERRALVEQKIREVEARE